MRKIKLIFKMLKSYLSYKMGIMKPFYGSFCITYKCNLKCSYCPWVINSKIDNQAYSEAKLNYFELNTQQAKEVIDKLDELGIAVMAITGGEPLLRNDLEEIVEYAKNKNILLWLNTNATLITKKRVESISRCFDSINISLAGNPKTNNKLRGESFRKIEEGIENLRRYSKVKIDINFPINKFNFKDIDWVVDFAKKKANSILFLPTEFTPEFLLDEKYRNEVKNKFIFLKEKYGNFINNNKEHLNLIADYITKKRTFVNCDAFNLYLAVGPSGELSGCCVYPYSVGNILRDDVKNLLRKGRRNKTKLIEKCSGCAMPPILVSLLFHQPIYKNIFLIKSFLKKTKVIPV